MTRINLVPVQELMDQHLFAEFREIKMVPKSLRRSLEAEFRRQQLRNEACQGGRVHETAVRFSAAVALSLRIPLAYTLNTGHVSFFYDKGAYLRKRYDDLKAELVQRGFNFNQDSPLDPDGMYWDYPMFVNDYTPTPDALVIIRTRIAEKIAMKPEWYKYEGKPIQ